MVIVGLSRENEIIGKQLVETENQHLILSDVHQALVLKSAKFPRSCPHQPVLFLASMESL